MMLKDKTILLGVTGGIAAYKSAMLASRLVKTGACVPRRKQTVINTAQIRILLIFFMSIRLRYRFHFHLFHRSDPALLL